MAKFPTIEEFAKEAAERALDDFEYEGKTIREWAELILRGKLVEVVRCKDCKHRADALDCGNYLCNRKMIGMVRPNDFCSFGERRCDDGL